MTDNWGESKMDVMNAKAAAVQKAVYDLNKALSDAAIVGLVTEIDNIEVRSLGGPPSSRLSAKVYLPL